MTTLAILGGEPEITERLRPYRSMGAAEKEAVVKVMDDDCLSGFFGSWQDGFLGGPRVQEFERSWAERFNVRHVVSVNSNTSGLIAAMGAIGISPGDEVILPPTTMSATAVAPLFYGGIPVFADLDPNDFCISVDAVKAAVTSRTRAVIAVNLFGHPAKLTELRQFCDERGIFLVEDNAQGPLASEFGKQCGTIGHIGVFSLNYHKHIHTGEGGMCCTDDSRLAERLQMIRNHAEAVVEQAGTRDLTNMIGMNLRLTELSAAIGLVQLGEIEGHVFGRVKFAEGLSSRLSGLEGFTVPTVRTECRHVYYNWMAKFDAELVGVSRERFNEALRAEGFPSFVGYVRPLYYLPLFQEGVAIGRNGFPLNLSERSYSCFPEVCSVAESLWREKFLGVMICNYALEDNIADRLANAFLKVYENRHLLVE